MMAAVAGEIEDSFSFNFQADSVHSGSISFGRFANEPLLWERRSSFSHNKILEEVERCSKHGLVTEKKAYFEAQFKRKALLRQCSSEGTCEKEYSGQSHKKDNGFNQGNESDIHPDTLARTGYDDCSQEAQVDIHYDRSSNTSDDFEEMDMIEYQVDGSEILISEPLKQPSLDSGDVMVKVDHRTVEPVETQTVIDCTFSRCNSVEPDLGVQQNTEAVDICAIGQESKKELDAVLDHKSLSPESTAAAEPSSLVPLVKATQTPRRKLTEAAKKSLSNMIRRDKQSALETKTYNHSKLSSRSTAKILPVSSKSERNLLSRSTSYTSKSVSGNRSVSQVSMGTRVNRSQVTALKKVTPTAPQTPNRPKKIGTPHDSDLKRPASSSFRSGVQPEKRKETEINRTQLRTQEKIKAETGQFGRSLSFKAKPMPSFYNHIERTVPKSKGNIISKQDKNPSNTRNHAFAKSSVHQRVVRASLIYPEKKLTNTTVLSSAEKMSPHPSTKKNAVGIKKAPVIDKKDVSSNKSTVIQNAEMTKGKGAIRTHNSGIDKISKFTTRKAPEKVSLDKLYRSAAKVHS